jgi:putative transposase
MFCAEPGQFYGTKTGAPELQFTSREFTGRLHKAEVAISMDGRGRALDNIFVERLLRTVKYEEVYLKDYQTPGEAYQNLKAYFQFYNGERLHQALGYRAPAAIYGNTSL